MRYEGTARSSRAFDDGAGTRIVVSTLGPGSLGGDNLRIEGTVGPRAHLIVTGQSATRVYGPGISRYVARWTVAEGATLELRNEPLLLFADAAYDARTEITLAHDARLLNVECVAAAERGPVYAQVVTTIRREGRLALRDAVRLDEHLLCGAVGTLTGFGGRLRDFDEPSAGIGTTRLGGTFVRMQAQSVWAMQQRLLSCYVLPFCDIK